MSSTDNDARSNVWGATIDTAYNHRVQTRFNHRVSRMRAAFTTMMKEREVTMFHWADYHEGLQIELVDPHFLLHRCCSHFLQAKALEILGLAFIHQVPLSVPRWFFALTKAINLDEPPTGIDPNFDPPSQKAILSPELDLPVRIVNHYVLNWWNPPGIKPRNAPAWDRIQIEDYELFMAQVSSSCMLCG